MNPEPRHQQTDELSSAGTGAAAFLQLGKTAAEQGRFEEAVRLLDRSLALCREHRLGDAEVAECLRMLVEANREARDYHAACRHICALLRLARVGNGRTAAVPLATLADLAGMLGHIVHLIGGEAGQAVREAVRLAEAMSDDPTAHKFRSSVYGTLGIYHTQTDDLQGALDAYRDAIAAAEAAGDERAAARWLSNLRQAYWELRQWDQADAIFRQTGHIYARLNDYQGAGNELLDRALAHLRDGDLARAAECVSNAFVLFHRAGQPNNMAYAALYFHYVYKVRREWERAERCLNYCLAQAERLGSRRLKGLALGAQADLAAARGDARYAVELYDRAIALAEEVGEKNRRAFYRQRGGLLQSLGRRAEAAADYRRAMAMEDEARQGLRANDRRLQAQERAEGSYLLLLRLLAETPEDPAAVSEAFAVAERARSRTLAEMLSRRRIRRPASLPAEAARRERQLLDRLSQLEAEDQAGLGSAEEYAGLSGELDELWRQIAAVDDACRDYVDLRRAPLVDAGQIAQFLAEWGDGR